jgi:uncharacterized protein (TIGR03000 family)
MCKRCLPLLAAAVVLLGSARASSAQFFFVPFGLGNPVFGYGYGGFGGYGYGGGWGYYPGGIGYNYFPRSYGAFTNYGPSYPAFNTAYAGYNTNPYYNGYNAAFGAQANYAAPAAYSLMPSYVAIARSNRTVAAEYVIPDQPAEVIVHVPEGAELWFDGHQTAQTGTERTFTTPALEKGTSYHYEVKARWTRDGKAVEDSQRVQVYAGGSISVTFPRSK